MAYDATVNKKGINMAALARTLTGREQVGWQLVTMFEQDGNTVQVFQSNTLLHQILAEQKRTNQLLEWLGNKLAPPSG